MFAKIPRTAKTHAAKSRAAKMPATAFAGEPGNDRGMPAIAMPPFWELEDLIAQGHAATEALAIMAGHRAATPFPVILSGDGDADDVRLSA
jgi:hypothetical protein